MGGLNAGEVASAIAIDKVRELFSNANLTKIAKNEKSIEKFMCDAVVKADEAIKQRVKKDPTTEGMGTTIIMVWLLETKAHLVWCGDSRGYIFNPTNGLRRISKDHSYVQQLVDEGKLDPELAFDHPNTNIITRCLGDFKGKACPDYKSYDLQEGDCILLCSDGLCGLCRDDEIQQVFRENYEDIVDCKTELIHRAMQAGGYDNCTVALCEIVSIGENLSSLTRKKQIPKPKKGTAQTIDSDEMLSIIEKLEESENTMTDNTDLLKEPKKSEEQQEMPTDEKETVEKVEEQEEEKSVSEELPDEKTTDTDENEEEKKQKALNSQTNFILKSNTKSSRKKLLRWLVLILLLALILIFLILYYNVSFNDIKNLFNK